jgi:hypothetical protein
MYDLDINHVNVFVSNEVCQVFIFWSGDASVFNWQIFSFSPISRQTWKMLFGGRIWCLFEAVLLLLQRLLAVNQNWRQQPKFFLSAFRKLQFCTAKSWSILVQANIWMNIIRWIEYNILTFSGFRKLIILGDFFTSQENSGQYWNFQNYIVDFSNFSKIQTYFEPVI